MHIEREGVGQREVMRSTLQLAGGATAGVVEFPAIENGFLFHIHTMILQTVPFTTAVAGVWYLNEIRPDYAIADTRGGAGYSYQLGPVWARAGERVIIDVGGATANSLIGASMWGTLFNLRGGNRRQGAPIISPPALPSGDSGSPTGDGNTPPNVASYPVEGYADPAQFAPPGMTTPDDDPTYY